MRGEEGGYVEDVEGSFFCWGGGSRWRRVGEEIEIERGSRDSVVMFPRLECKTHEILAGVHF